MKASFQIINTAKPNSVTNICVFSLFEAPDSVFNLHLALDQYKSPVSSLQNPSGSKKLNTITINI